MSDVSSMADFSTIPVGQLGLIALPGCEELTEKIDSYLRRWREERESEHKTTIGGIPTSSTQTFRDSAPAKQSAISSSR